MKKLLPTILLSLLLSCTKENGITNNCKSVSYIVDQYNKEGIKYNTYLSYDFGVLCGEELSKWEMIKVRAESICGTTDTMRLIIK